jgi:hypothetical protein
VNDRPEPAKTKQRAERDKRLAEALRANLKRRKAAADVRRPGESDGRHGGRPHGPEAGEKT